MVKETITVDYDVWSEMVDDSNFLQALRSAGVDNWDGYDYAIEIYEEMQKGED